MKEAMDAVSERGSEIVKEREREQAELVNQAAETEEGMRDSKK